MKKETNTAALTAAQQAQPAEPFTTRELVLMNEGYAHAKQFGLQQAQPERAPLSDAEIKELLPYSWPWGIEFARAIEAAHGIKQGGQQ